MSWVSEAERTGSSLAPAEPATPIVRGDAGKARAMPLAPGAVARGGSLQLLIVTRLAPYVSRKVQYIGRTGVAGIALLVFTVAFFFGANSPLRSQLAVLQSDLADADSAHRTPADAAAEVSPNAQLQAFVNRLPARAELPAITEKIVAQAAAAGLALERGSYDVSVTHSGGLVRARLSFPVQGRYPDIRRFVDGTLAAIPGAAVDGLRLARKDIAAREIEADVQFAVYLRSAP